MDIKIKSLILSMMAASLAAMALAGCGRGSSEGAAAAAVADTADYNDPIIDESTLLADTVDTDADDPEPGIPPRRFSTKEQALNFMKNSGDWDKYSQGILPRMLDDCFPYADRLLNNKHQYFIVSDKQSMKVVLFDRYGRIVKSYAMACARNFGTKHRRSDCRTPEGFFYAQGVYDSTDWLYTDDNGYTSPTRGVYGPRFIRVKADVTASIGIHGTGSPGSLGSRVSHGCMRVANSSILDLVKYVHPGTPIIVNPSDRDVAVNRSEGYDIPQIHTGLSSADTSHNFSGDVNGDYPAAPAAPVKNEEPADSTAAVADSVAAPAAVLAPEELPEAPHSAEPDSIAH